LYGSGTENDGGIVSTTDDALEQRLGDLLREGDSSAAATLLIRSYGPLLLGYLQAVLRSNDDAAEAFSLVCETVWGDLTCPHRRTFKAWAYAIAWREALRVAENPGRKRPRLLQPETEKLADEVRSLAAPHLVMTHEDRLVELRQALDPAERTLLILRIDRGMSWAEVAYVLAEGEDNLRKRFERIKLRLRDLAVARGLVPQV
jgi:RNA polymerase sigma-70 factor (ECF subfamily)